MYLKMLGVCAWLLCLMAVVLVEAEFVEPSRSLRLRPGAHEPRIQWGHPSLEDFSYSHASEDTSRLHASVLGEKEGRSEHAGYSASSLPEHWRHGPANLTGTGGNAHGYSRPYWASSSSSSSSGGASQQDALRGTHTMFQYRHAVRPPLPSQPILKKFPPPYLIGKLQVQNPDGSQKAKYKKTVLYHSSSVPAGYKNYKNHYLHPRIHKPYAKHKYPIQKTVHPLYRRYYQSPYQRYAIPSTEMLRHKLASQVDDGHYKTSTAAPTPSQVDYHTTERMDDAYPDGSAPSEDYPNYNDTFRKAAAHYYETEEEFPKTAASDPDPDSDPYPYPYDEVTTRGYYGDRVYMSTQIPTGASDKFATKNGYFIVRRTSDEDDIETIFD